MVLVSILAFILSPDIPFTVFWVVFGLFVTLVVTVRTWKDASCLYTCINAVVSGWV